MTEVGINWSHLSFGSIQLTLSGKMKHAVGWVSNTDNPVDPGMAVQTAS